MNLADILILKFPGIDLIQQVKLQDDGNGPYIAKWDDTLGPKPTAEQLKVWEQEVVPLKQAAEVRQNRRNEYLPIGDQLDALWHAMDGGVIPKIEPIYSAHKAVKQKYPKAK